MQEIIVAVAIAWAAIHVARSLVRSLRLSGCGTGCGKCGSVDPTAPRDGAIPLNVIKSA